MQIADEIEVDYEDIRGLKETIGSFLESPGWKFVSAFLASRAEAREKELIRSCPCNTETMVAYARVRGGIDELLLIPQMLAQVYSDLETSVHKMQDTTEGEEE